MQISSEDVDERRQSQGSDRQRRAKMNKMFPMCWRCTNTQKIPVSLMEFEGNLVSHFDSRRI